MLHRRGGGGVTAGVFVVIGLLIVAVIVIAALEREGKLDPETKKFCAELSLEQLFFNRPVPGWARYRTPVKDLWMCGSATHPGGGIMGAPGRIAAMEVLGSGRARRRASEGR